MSGAAAALGVFVLIIIRQATLVVQWTDYSQFSCQKPNAIKSLGPISEQILNDKTFMKGY